MKRFFVWAVLAAMFFLIGCGGGTDPELIPGDYGSSQCSYGTYECHGDDSYFCGYINSNDLNWLLSETCNNGCDYSTGQCKTASNEENNQSENTEENPSDNSNKDNVECTAGDSRCEGNYSFYCYDGKWGYFDDCSTRGCNPETGTCYPDSGNDNGGESSGGSEDSSGSGSTTECYTGIYVCDGTFSYCYLGGNEIDYGIYCDYGCNTSTGQCNNYSGGGGSTTGCSSGQYICDGSYISKYCAGGYWDSGTYCEYGCISSTGRCNNDSSSVSPCRPEASASVSGSTVKLKWTYKTSSGCGTPTKTTVKWHDPNYGWIEAESRNASSFTSTSLGITGCGYQEDGRWLLLAGILVENDAGASVAYCNCNIDAKECKCY